MSLTSEDVDAIAGLVNDLCGIVLDQSKAYLIESRLSDLVSRENCKNYVELAQRARAFSGQPLQKEIVNSITTNETLFFRDSAPFEAMRHKILPHMIDARSGSLYPTRLRIWSAACSTGQEAYSIAMTLREMIPDVDDWDIMIMATDISDAVIEKASRGIYAAHEIQRGLPPQYLAKYFTAQGNQWKICDEVRSMVKFQKMNLLQPFTHLPKFDVIFCRNVAIYFTADVRRDLFNRIAQQLVPDGVLFVGSAESPGESFVFENHCRAVVYRRKGSPSISHF